MISTTKSVFPMRHMITSQSNQLNKPVVVFNKSSQRKKNHNYEKQHIEELTKAGSRNTLL